MATPAQHGEVVQRVRAALGHRHHVVDLPFDLTGETAKGWRPIGHPLDPRRGRGGHHIGDAEDKDAHYDQKRLEELGFFGLDHEELPDVVAYSKDKDWLYVVEAVATSGPVDPYRHARLRSLLRDVDCEGAIYVTAFLGRDQVFRKFAPEISWETEVWVASEPDHLIHFDGERFLGPYESDS